MPKRSKVVMAKKCKLLAGNYQGQTNGCPCKMTTDCRIPEEEREELYDHEEVVETRAQNLKDYQARNP